MKKAGLSLFHGPIRSGDQPPVPHIVSIFSIHRDLVCPSLFAPCFHAVIHFVMLLLYDVFGRPRLCFPLTSPECDFREEQQGSRKGRGTADGMYIPRQMVEKRLEVQGSMALGFVELEKRLTQYPERRRWRRYGGWEYQKRKRGWLRACTRRQQQEWWWEKEHRISLRSILEWSRAACWDRCCTLLYTGIMDLISRKTVLKDATKKLFYIQTTWSCMVANSKQEYRRHCMDEWHGLFTRHRLKINLRRKCCTYATKGKSWISSWAGGEETDSGGTVSCILEHGKTEREVRRRAQVGANALKQLREWWRTTHSHINVMNTCGTQACLYGTETLAMTELKQQKRQVCENNCSGYDKLQE